MKNEKNVWICESEKVLLDSPFMAVIQRDCRSSEDSRKHKFFVFRSRSWTNIIPITEDGKIVLIRQYRIGISDHTIEVPGGVNDPTDPDHQSAAIREMTEETGYVPLPGARCIPLGWTHPNPAIMDNQCHSFIVGPVRRDQLQKLDPGEMIEVMEVPIRELPAMIARGEVTHALMLNAFFFLMMRSQEGSDFLARQLEDFTRPGGVVGTVQNQ